MIILSGGHVAESQLGLALFQMDGSLFLSPLPLEWLFLTISLILLTPFGQPCLLVVICFYHSVRPVLAYTSKAE